MTPQEKGRHCDACDKVVVDFTKSSKHEIIDHLEKAEGKTCGRFRSDQIHKAPTRTPNLSKIAASIMAIVGAQGVINAQGGANIMIGDVIAEPGPDPIEIKATNAIRKVITGTVVNPQNHPVHNARVAVFSGGHLVTAVLTDANGTYKIELQAGTVIQDIVNVRVHAGNYSTKNLNHLTLRKDETTLNFTMSEEDKVMLMGKIRCEDPEPVEHIKGQVIAEPEEVIYPKGDVALVTIEPVESTHLEWLGQPATVPTPGTEAEEGSLPEVSEVDSIDIVANTEIETTVEDPDGTTQENTASAPGNENTHGSELSNNLKMEVYPNPSNGLVYTSVSEAGEYQYSITDILGNQLSEGFFIGTKMEFSFRNHPPGVYLINLYQQDDLKMCSRVMIQ